MLLVAVAWSSYDNIAICNMLCTSSFVDDIMLPIISQAKAMPVGHILKVTHQGAEPGEGEV